MNSEHNRTRVHADDLGITPTRLHPGGASAGVNLVAVISKRLRGGGEVMPASVLLVHLTLPPMDDELTGAVVDAVRSPILLAEERPIVAPALG
jgi:acetyl esterase/lipase